MTLPERERFAFTHGGRTREVLYEGAGPPVVVIHELPGPTPQVLAFVREVAGAGFTAVMPVLFGTPGRPFAPAYLVREFAGVCIRREIRCLSRRRSSPVSDWLRALCRQVQARWQSPGVGVVGMCLTGGFALALAADPAVLAPVLSQPSLPLGLTAGHRRALGVSDAELGAVRQRASQGYRVLGLRFSADRWCPKARFDTLRRELGEGFEAVEIDSAPGNPWHIPARAHSVLTLDRVAQPGHPTDDALRRVLEFLRERLSGSQGEAGGATA